MDAERSMKLMRATAEMAGSSVRFGMFKMHVIRCSTHPSLIHRDHRFVLISRSARRLYRDDTTVMAKEKGLYMLHRACQSRFFFFFFLKIQAV